MISFVDTYPSIFNADLDHRIRGDHPADIYFTAAGKLNRIGG